MKDGKGAESLEQRRNYRRGLNTGGYGGGREVGGTLREHSTHTQPQNAESLRCSSINTRGRLSHRHRYSRLAGYTHSSPKAGHRSNKLARPTGMIEPPSPYLFSSAPFLISLTSGCPFRRGQLPKVNIQRRLPLLSTTVSPPAFCLEISSTLHRSGRICTLYACHSRDRK